MTLRTLIVDDEAAARRRLRRLLAHDPTIVVIGECADGASALASIRRDRPDLVFLDIEMPEADGLEVVRLLPADAPAVVFVTAFDRYAINAFEVHAVDYLLKPASTDRLATTIARVKERLRTRQSTADLAAALASLRERPRYLSRVSVRTAGRVLLVDLSSVDWIEAADNYVRLHVGAREYLLRETLAALEKQLDPEHFVRIHRSVIVRIDRIAELHPATHGDMDIVLKNGAHLTLSRTFRDRLDRRLFFGGQ